METVLPDSKGTATVQDRIGFERKSIEMSNTARRHLSAPGCRLQSNTKNVRPPKNVQVILNDYAAAASQRSGAELLEAGEPFRVALS